MDKYILCWVGKSSDTLLVIYSNMILVIPNLYWKNDLVEVEAGHGKVGKLFERLISFRCVAFNEIC